jgi:hypothetical protein
LEFRILGPLEVVADGRHLRISSGRQRALLAILLLRANQIVGFDELVEAVWGDSAPMHPRSAVHTCVTRLRNTIGVVVESRADGYRIVVDEAAVDLARFEAAIRSGEAEALREGLELGELDRAAVVLGQALLDARRHATQIHEALANMLLGIVMRENGDLEKSLQNAIAAYDSPINRESRREEPMLGLAAVHRDAGRYDIAMDYCLAASDQKRPARLVMSAIRLTRLSCLARSS